MQGPGPTYQRLFASLLADALAGVLNLPAGLRGWRQRRHTSPAWTAIVAAILLIVALPIATVVLLALTPADNIWPHLVSTVLPGAVLRTLLLCLGVGLVTFTVGTAAAWLVTMYRFPARELLDRLLVLPLAVPTYIVAYCYVELLDYAGPVQTHLRSALGVTTAAGYWFPNVRLAWRSGLRVLGRPLSVRLPHGPRQLRAAIGMRARGRAHARPLAARYVLRCCAAHGPPAIAAGVALVIMECLNDLGAVQYLGVDTLSASIYATWMQRANIGGAAQIATVMLLLGRRALGPRARVAPRRAQPPHHWPLPRHTVPGARRLEGQGRGDAGDPAVRIRLFPRAARRHHPRRRGPSRRRPVVVASSFSLPQATPLCWPPWPLPWQSPSH
ncbi:MAG: hypothetical protein WDN31_14245 [Hyphomicrobium sp.]